MSALALFTLGYAIMALLSPGVAALPAIVVFVLAGHVLVSQAPPARDGAEAIARELLRD